MDKKEKTLPIIIGTDDKRLFWGILAAAVVLTVIGIMLGNPFEDYQTSSTL
ncbi:MAG: hypothetical protein HQL17_02660 [Candidatus Omnitrophica bacterium]|nr:hypothetical protein [Candidatus Omnitrophota bacterium]